MWAIGTLVVAGLTVSCAGDGQPDAADSAVIRVQVGALAAPEGARATWILRSTDGHLFGSSETREVISERADADGLDPFVVELACEARPDDDMRARSYTVSVELAAVEQDGRDVAGLLLPERRNCSSVRQRVAARASSACRGSTTSRRPRARA